MIGIIGGLGGGGTTHYYPALVGAHKRRDLVPQLPIAHAKVDRVLADIRDGKLTELASIWPASPTGWRRAALLWAPSWRSRRTSVSTNWRAGPGCRLSA